VSPFALELLGITKVYGATEVLHGVDLCVRPGNIHALLGANGAGKSTLLKIAVGAASPTSGRILLNGQERHFSSPLEARKLGIGMVFQERSLIPDLSTVDNIFLNGEIRQGGLIQQRAQRRETHRIFERLGVHISTAARVGQLSIADQQMVEIAKALRLASAVLILDEPTAALTEREVQRLFAVLRQIARSDVGIVYVSHRLGEVFDLCDEATVIRDGRVVLSTSMAHTNLREVVEAIAGGAVQGLRASAENDLSRSQVHDRLPVLEVRGLDVGAKLNDISFDVRPAEILGIAGLAGSGRSTLLKALFGLVPRRRGRISIGGRQVDPTSPGKAIRDGFYLIPEDRKTQGLVLSHTVEANLVISILRRICFGLLISAQRSAQVAVQTIAQLRIHPPDPGRPVEWLSGGNQQKVVLGKAFNARAKVLLLDEPTFGVDIRSRAEISNRIRSFADEGNGVLWVTSDLRELREVADRIIILADGMVRDIVTNRPQPLSESELTHLIQTAAAR
jgi:ribose transport system ATP-binding protein